MAGLINSLGRSGVNIVHWVPTSGEFPGIKVATSSTWFPPSELSDGDVKYTRWHPGSLRRQLVIGRVGKDLRQNEDLKSLMAEAIDNAGLRSDGIVIQQMKKKTNKGLVDTPFLRLAGLDEGVISHLIRKGYITLEYRAYPVRLFVPKRH